MPIHMGEKKVGEETIDNKRAVRAVRLEGRGHEEQSNQD